MISRCRICGNEQDNKDVKLQGAFYGTKGEFDYFICSKCGCLQITKLPEDIGRYYDSEQYYSFNMDKRSTKNKLLFMQLKNQIKEKNLVGALVQNLYPVDYSAFANLSASDAILDIGCGQGELLKWLEMLGFTNLEGVEPFIDKDYTGENGIRIFKSEVCDFKPEHKYKLISFMHSLEHIYDVKEVVSTVADWVEDDGVIAITIPFFSNYYWEKYGVYLHILDPPRHFYLHTKKSVCKLMEEVGFELKYFDTEINPSIPWMARNNKLGKGEKNGGANFVLDSIISLTSKGLRRKLKKQEDGAIATFVFAKKSN